MLRSCFAEESEQPQPLTLTSAYSRRLIFFETQLGSSYELREGHNENALPHAVVSPSCTCYVDCFSTSPLGRDRAKCLSPQHDDHTDCYKGIEGFFTNEGRQNGSDDREFLRRHVYGYGQNGYRNAATPNQTVSVLHTAYIAMFMDGFQWSTTTLFAPKVRPCLNYFVASWKLENSGAFRGACFFSFLLAIVLESTAAARVFVMARLPPEALSYLSTLIYVVQAVLGYLLMFVAMTYSVELVGSVVVGLIVGKYIFAQHAGPEETMANSNHIDDVTMDTSRRSRNSTSEAIDHRTDERSASLRRRGDR